MGDLGQLLGTTGATLLGGTLGAVARLAPEVLKLLDRGNERKHELALLDRNIAAENARAASGLKEHELAADSAQVTGGIAALTEAVKAQAVQTGNKIIDGINMTVRPVLTYLIAGPYALGKLLVFTALLWSGTRAGFTSDTVQAALNATYTIADMAIVSGLLNFWFLGRVFDKRS